MTDHTNGEPQVQPEPYNLDVCASNTRHFHANRRGIVCVCKPVDDMTSQQFEAYEACGVLLCDLTGVTLDSFIVEDEEEALSASIVDDRIPVSA